MANPSHAAHLMPDATTTDPAAQARIAVLPVGSFEQHGPHLPLVTDTLIAVAIANTISERHTVRQLPPITISCSHEHAAFAGTVSISAATLAAVVEDIASSLTSQGTDRLVLVNAHGGNYLLSNVVQQANAIRPRTLALFPSRDDWTDARRAAQMTTDQHNDMHAGELETSILLAAFPDYLRDGWQHDDHTAPDRRHLLTLGIGSYTPTGVIGRPSLASAEKGQAALHSFGENSKEMIKNLTATH